MQTRHKLTDRLSLPTQVSQQSSQFITMQCTYMTIFLLRTECGALLKVNCNRQIYKDIGRLGWKILFSFFLPILPLNIICLSRKEDEASMVSPCLVSREKISLLKKQILIVFEERSHQLIPHPSNIEQHHPSRSWRRTFWSPAVPATSTATPTSKPLDNFVNPTIVIHSDEGSSGENFSMFICIHLCQYLLPFKLGLPMHT